MKILRKQQELKSDKKIYRRRGINMKSNIKKKLLALFLCICMVMQMTDLSSIVVHAATALDASKITLGIAASGDTIEYTGVAIEPKVFYDGAELTKGTHYTCTLSKNTDVGMATMVIRGDGTNYSGSVTKYFEIKPADITVATVKYKVKGESEFNTVAGTTIGTQYFENSSNETEFEKIEICWTNGNSEEVKLTEGQEKDYTVKYEHGEPGVSDTKLNIYGHKNFKGEINITYPTAKKKNIADEPISAIANTDPSESPNKDGMWLMDTPIANVSDPQVTFTNGLSLGTDYIASVTPPQNEIGTGKIVLKGINAYCGVKEVLYCVVRDISTNCIIDPIQPQTYTGKEIDNLELKVRDSINGKELKQGQDYEYNVKYANNINVGYESAEITISGNPKNGYKGDKIVNFTIEPLQITDNGDFEIKIKDKNECKFDGVNPVKPTIQFFYKGTEIKMHDDLVNQDNYIVEYSNNTSITKNAKITVIGNWNLKGSLTTTFEIPERSIDDQDITFSISGNPAVAPYKLPVGKVYEGAPTGHKEQTYTDAEIKSLIKLYDEKKKEELKLGTHYEVKYKNNETAGTATLRLLGLESGSFGGEIDVDFTIEPAPLNDLSARGKLNISINNDNPYMYTGNAIEPTDMVVSYTNSDGDKVTLVKDKDYVITGYRDNIDATEKAVVTIKGIGNYKEEASGEFKISKLDISQYECTIPSQKYKNGVEVTVDASDIQLKTPDGNVLVAGVDYDYAAIEYENNKNVTTATSKAVCKIKGKGNYEGVKVAYFRIKKDIAELSTPEYDALVYNGLEQTANITIKDGDYTLIQGTDFVYTVKEEKKLLNAGNYELAISVPEELGNYNETYMGKVTLPVKIKQKPLSDSDIKLGEMKNQQYTGNNIEAKINVLCGDVALEQGKDFTVKYTNNRNVSDMYGVGVIIKAVDAGNYSGEKSFENAYRIERRQLNAATEEPGVNYTIKTEIGAGTNLGALPFKGEDVGVEIEGDVSVVCTYMDFDGKAKEITLSASDYTVSYENNNKIGDAIANIKGRGNYTGVSNTTFIIYAEMKDVTVKEIANQIYTGKPIEPKLGEKGVYYDYKTKSYTDRVFTSEEYDVTYANNINAGTASMTITGKGDYLRGSKTISFVIAKKNLDNTDNAENRIVVENFEETKVFTGRPVKQDVKVTYGDIELKEGVDYELVYTSNNIDVTSETSKVTMSVAALDKCNFTGRLDMNYAITPRDIGDELGDVIMEGIDKEILYKGETVEQALDKVNINVYYTNKDAGMEKEPMTFGTVEQANSNASIDYTVSYENNDNIGIANIVITGYNNYTGTYRVPFKIYADLNDKEHTEITEIKDVEYTGGEIIPNIYITCWGNLLEQGKDFVATAVNNKELASKNDLNPPKVTIVANTEDENCCYKGTLEATFSIIKKNLSSAQQTEDDTDIRVESGSNMVYTGMAIIPEISIYNHGNLMAEGVDYKIEIIPGDDMVNVGEKHAKITAVEDSHYEGAMELIYKIIPRDISEGVIKVADITPVEYTGSEITLSGYKVSYSNVLAGMAEKALVEGKDYEVTYENNIEIGTATMIINGIGNYTGVSNQTFQIGKRSLEKAVVTVETGFLENGKAEPPVKVELNGVLLDPETDYNVSYTNNTKTADANTTPAPTATVVGKGNYVGTASATFEIIGKMLTDDTITVDEIEAETFDASEHRPVPVLNENTIDSEGNVQTRTLTEGKDYSIAYEDNVAGGTAKAVLTGMGSYSGERIVKFTIRPLEIVDGQVEGGKLEIKGIEDVIYSPDQTNLPETTLVYTNTATKKSYTLVEGHDYEIISSDTKLKVGENEIVFDMLEGGSFIGSLEGKFDMYVDMEYVNVGAIGTQVYNGNELRPDPEVSFMGELLERDSDYTVSYVDNNKVGTAKIVFTSVNGSYYTNNKTVEFIIAEMISSEQIDVKGISTAGYYYTGKEIRPAVIVRFTGASASLQKDVDYTISYKNNINVGKATIVISLLGRYTGIMNCEFKIKEKSIAGATVSAIKDQTYTGKAITPVVTVKDGAMTLKAGTDYTVEYVNNNSIGIAQMVIKGKGNYSGAKKAFFNIKYTDPKSLKAASITASSMKLSWSMSGKADEYEIYNASTNKLVTRTKSKSITLKKLASGTTYKYKVRARVKLSGVWRYSKFTSTLTASTKPAAPSIKVKSSKAKKATVTWKKIKGATGYEIYRSTSSKGTYKKIKKITKGSTVSYTDSGLTGGKKYYYKVRTYRTVSGKTLYSSYSKVVSVTAKK